MIIKKYLTILIIVITLFLSIFSSIPSQSLKTKSIVDVQNQSLNAENPKKIRNIQLNIIVTTKDGNTEKIVKIVNENELDKLKEDLINNLTSNLDYMEKFEYVLHELKENNLISNNIKIKDIIDLSRFENFPLKFNNVTNKNFVAYFAPTIIVGGGFGLGLGFSRRPNTAFQHFFAVMSGAAFVLCLDILNSTAYILLTLFFLPSFIGYMAGFTGIVMFAVYPGLFYSNLLMIGFAPFSVWLSIPESED